ncbi:uncharacterized protein TNCV_3193191 [Trichonephila clavipes]|nr:uncharacterized protein TNCV_3193191 [Trichonephila clavipes]
MTSCNHKCCHSCNGSHNPFFNKTMLGLTLQGCHKTVYALLLLFLGLPDPQICLQSSISGIYHQDTSDMERNVLRHHTELVCLNARSYRIEYLR